ncbi:HAD family hydrolase [Arthrobacter sp. zg-Y820]|uniref:HAD family hydrolase n=1 Tax=unclassified Arthrobacter TaxID=235627 RepID=UPI001E5E136B|nr:MULTISPECIES: HAD family hydrolase [unclassified Arthrobacter]MCC9196183.1 HAD family hydrolase [Arthrobacter sp. zg-Y820]MDK1279043.1 HAD family hydrolase [Arthrobacter sp. zg.Y820]MDK1359341.1 HAD family hydrolase [Arthrobacter sp. zg-Y1219]WIB08547.1 HAD family hydrolase [Arthrobacter sp. zg-Y820]
MKQRRQVRGVLFDIDETLVDLQAAMGTTLQSLGRHDLAHFTAEEWTAFKALFTADPEGYYDRYLAGELSFADQRVRRLQHARRSTGQPLLDDDAAEHWNTTYEATLPLHFRAFDDVVPLLDELDARGIPYGAVSNNVHDYQRAKLDAAGLQRITVLVGIDTVGAAKPEPAIFHEGVRRLGSDAAQTLYVGDNLRVDAEGACAAGLRGVWLDRPEYPSPVRSGSDPHPTEQIAVVRSLREVVRLATG